MLQRHVLPIKAHGAAAQGLSRPQAEALHLLSCRDWATIKLMAELLGISSSAATQLTEGLAQLDLVSRSEDPADRRVVQVRLTDAGRDKVRALRDSSRQYIEGFLDAMSDIEIKHLLTLLTKLAHSSGADQHCR